MGKPTLPLDNGILRTGVKLMLGVTASDRTRKF
jgi:hypothetical protein